MAVQAVAAVGHSFLAPVSAALAAPVPPAELDAFTHEEAHHDQDDRDDFQLLLSLFGLNVFFGSLSEKWDGMDHRAFFRTDICTCNVVCRPQQPKQWE